MYDVITMSFLCYGDALHDYKMLNGMDNGLANKDQPALLKNLVLAAPTLRMALFVTSNNKGL